MADHWSAGLIGRAYVPRAAGPDAFDCWGLCKYVWRTRCGYVAPDIAIDPANKVACRRAFLDFGNELDNHVSALEVQRPREYDAVYMTRSRLPDHIGLWTEPDARGGILHALEHVGVVFSRASSLRAIGIHILAFHRPKGLS